MVGRTLLLVGAGELVEHPRPALAALLEGLHHVLDLFGRGVVVAEGEVGEFLVDQGLDPFDGSGADAVGLGIGGGDLLAVEAALARIDLQVADVQADAGKAHLLAAVDELPGNVLLHGRQGVVQAGLEEDVVVGLGVEVGVVLAAVELAAVHLVAADLAVGVVEEPLRVLLEELVARLGPAGPVDVGDRPHAHGLEHPVLLEDGLAAAVGQASLAAGEEVVGGGQVGDVARGPGEELEVDPPHLLPVLHAAPGILAGGGADVEAAGAAVARPVGAVAAGAAGDPQRELGDGEEVASAGDFPAAHEQPHADLPPVLLRAERVGGGHLLLLRPAARLTFSRKTSRRVSAARISSPTSVPSIGAAVGLTREVSTVTFSWGW